MKYAAKTLVALSLLCVCTACANQPAKTALLDKPQQFSDIRWDEVAAASTTAKVTNTSLIMMR